MQLLEHYTFKKFVEVMFVVGPVKWDDELGRMADHQWFESVRVFVFFYLFLNITLRLQFLFYYLSLLFRYFKFMNSFLEYKHFKSYKFLNSNQRTPISFLT